MGLPTNQAMNVIRQMLHNEYPQVALQDLAMMVPAKMKQIEEEIKASNTEVINVFCSFFVKILDNVKIVC